LLTNSSTSTSTIAANAADVEACGGRFLQCPVSGELLHTAIREFPQGLQADEVLELGYMLQHLIVEVGTARRSCWERKGFAPNAASTFLK